jgi:hypothetical protein
VVELFMISGRAPLVKTPVILLPKQFILTNLRS